MGKFDGVLLYSDYDDTLYNSAHTVSPENHAAIRYFQENGGRFSVATGRAHRTFTPQIAREGLSLNAPVVLSNGAALYDYEADRYLTRTFLDEAAPARFAQLCARFPDLAFEAYHGEDIYVHNPNAVTVEHLRLVGGTQIPCPIGEMPTPWVKVIMEQDVPYLKEVQAHLLRHWADDYEAIFSNPYLLEVTAKGSHKGAMVEKAARLLGVSPENLYCIGDNQNDIPMLALSAIPFAPANCSQPVKDWGARILGSCDDHAVAQAIEILDSIY
ncbi:MAG: HAD hydrolase family protein [Clostridiales bacterium]|nr:HAD hydrolase family protein [Clostridiales bacterium]